MTRIHPNVCPAVALAALAISLGSMGCQSSSGEMTNPFLAPNRVPPPATRQLAPGEAQPYYPGDPVPVMHSRLEPAADGASGFAGRAASDHPPAAALVRTTEPTIAIPDDGQALRFALPAAMEPDPAVPTLPEEQSSIQWASMPAAPGVVPASHDVPVSRHTDNAPSLAHGPWRPPQIPAAASSDSQQAMHLEAPPFAAAATYQPASAPAAAANQAPAATAALPAMPVRLRAVSPPPEVQSTATPRIRMPSHAMASSPVGGNDGFRPRSSMR